MKAMAFFDSHCHLQDPRLEGKLDAALARARQSGVSHMVCCATREADWYAVLDLSRRHSDILPMLGLHPWYAQEAASGWLERLRAGVECGRIGIGECGLDFAIEDPRRELQESVFRHQLRLARELGRPISIHCRRAWERLAAITREEGLPPTGAVIHAFSGSPEVARELQAMGFSLSFSGSLANPENTRGAKAVVAVAEDRLVFETDAPDMLPRSLSSESLNEPANVRLVAETAARLRQVPVAALAERVYANSLSLFGGLLP
jgi:TatD DNase family protein